MCARARERFAADRKRRRPRAQAPAPPRDDAQPDHHRRAQVRDDVASTTTSACIPRSRCRSRRSSTSSSRSRTWDLGLDWYRGRFDDRFPVRGESSPHYTNQPRFTGVAERIQEHIPDAKLIYMVRDPISRMLSHWRHATGAGYETAARSRRSSSRPDHRLRPALAVLDAAPALPRALRARRRSR